MDQLSANFSTRVLFSYTLLATVVLLFARGQSLTVVDYGVADVLLDFDQATAIPVGTAADGGETTFQLHEITEYTITEATGGPTFTGADEISGILVASAAGFVIEYTELHGDPYSVHLHGQYGCSGEEGGEGSGRCTLSAHFEDLSSPALIQDDIGTFTSQTAVTTYVFAVESITPESSSSTVESITPGSSSSEVQSIIPESSSGFFANRAAVIGTFIAVAIVVIAAFVSLLLFRYRLKSRKKALQLEGFNPSSPSPKEIAPGSFRPFDLKYHAPDESLSIHENPGRSSSPFRPFDLKYEEPTIEPANPSSSSPPFELNSASAPQNIGSSPSPLGRSHSGHSTIRTTTTQTARQIHLQSEADDLRQQIRELQQSTNADVQGMQLAMTRMMTHIQALEAQVNSDWARGLTDEPPPTYMSSESRMNS